MTALTSKAQQEAVVRLAQLGGSGVIDRFGFMVAGGERLSFDPATWLRLIIAGLVEVAPEAHLALSADGRKAAREMGIAARGAR